MKRVLMRLFAATWAMSSLMAAVTISVETKTIQHLVNLRGLNDELRWCGID